MNLVEQERLAFEHWKMYDKYRNLPEVLKDATPPSPIRAGRPEEEYRQYLPFDPTHPRAYIPIHVRYAKRQQVQFTCPITGWLETDWYQDKQHRGPYRFVGKLTMDHINPGALGGLTEDSNIRAISMLANTKKGAKTTSDEDLRKAILGSYEKIELPEDLVKILREYNITQFKVG